MKKINLPNVVTLAGLILGLWGAYSKNATMLVASLALDIADGWIARKTGKETEFGSKLDWYTDVCIGHVICSVLFVAPWSNAVLVLVQSYADEKSVRFSGRSTLVVLYLVKVAYGA